MVPIIEHASGAWRMEPEDEALHPVGSEQLWNESWYFDFASADGSVGGYVRLGLYPNWGRAWYWACLVRDGQPLVMLADNEAPLSDWWHGEAQGESRRLVTAVPAYTAAQETLRPLEAVRLTLDLAPPRCCPIPPPLTTVVRMRLRRSASTWNGRPPEALIRTRTSPVTRSRRRLPGRSGWARNRSRSAGTENGITAGANGTGGAFPGCGPRAG